MRIAYVCADPGIPVWGNKGCSIHVQEILHTFVEAGIEVHLIALKDGGSRPAGLGEVSLHLIDASLPREYGMREQARQQLNEDFDRLLMATGPFDFVYERYSLWSYAGVEYAQRTDVPGLLEVNAPLVEEQAQHRVLVDRDGALAATRRAFGAASVVLPVSEQVAQYVKSLGVPPYRIHVLPNAVDPERFGGSQPRRQVGGAEFSIGFVGSLKPWHGVDQLIAAYKQLWATQSGWRLKIAGDGPDRERLETLAHALGDTIARTIEFCGELPNAEIPDLLKSLDAAVAPGVSGEAYFSPIKIFEYMAAGLPTVAANVGQMSSLLKHGVTGLLYNAGDSADLARALVRLRAEAWTAKRLGAAAWAEVCTHHCWVQRRDAILRLVQCSRPVQAEAG